MREYMSKVLESVPKKLILINKLTVLGSTLCARAVISFSFSFSYLKLRVRVLAPICYNSKPLELDYEVTLYWITQENLIENSFTN